MTGEAVEQVTAPPPRQVTVQPVPATATAPSAPSTSRAAPTHLPPTETASTAPVWPTPVHPVSAFAPAPVTAAEVHTAEKLAAAWPPARDDLQLAREYRGLVAVPTAPAPTLAPNPGEQAHFNVLNIDTNTIVPITATLLGVSEHAYFWFDDAYSQPVRAALRPVEDTFDQIYDGGVAAFGPERGNGIDGERRVHVVHASPAALCTEAGSCGLAGYFSGADNLPRAVRAASNERKMFVMNADKFGTDFYLNVLAHEFRHMIEDNHDPADIDWEVEGSAMLAEELAGFTENAHARGNAFLAEPDQQLNRWSEENTYTRYGQGYVLNRYIYDRLGPELYRAFATHPADGLDAVTAVAEANQLPFDGEQLWREWLATLAIHRHPQAPAIYRLGDGSLDTVALTPVSSFPFSATETVHQYAADYYRLQGGQPLTLTFTGGRRVPLLNTAPPSGSHFWYANRANYSHLQLERPFDLRPAISATLLYSVWHEIEYGYDFAYLSASTDGGETWTPLVADQMQGLEAADNPAGKALADRFYTGDSSGWLAERVDLSAYAGQEVWLRFSYITDPILTFGGLALDNLAIPQIEFYDAAEGDAGWEAAGFTRATATLPQQWHLQLIRLREGAAPLVTPLPLAGGNSLSTEIALPPGEEAILVVAASAPLTLEEAVYRLAIDD